MNKLNRILNTHQGWIEAGLVMLNTLSAGFLTYRPSDSYIIQHPLRGAIINWLCSWFPYVLIGTAVALFLLFCLKHSWNKTVQVLERQLESYRDKVDLISENVENLFNSQLQGLFGKIASAKASNSCRITLYIFDTDSFIRCGRYSSNPIFCSPGRPSYPMNEGCIRRGWEAGWFFDNTLSNEPPRRRQEHLTRYNIKGKTSLKFRMPSVLYGVLRISDKSRSIGVIVFESIDKDVISEDHLRRELEAQAEDIGSMATVLWEHIPRPATATSLEL